MTWVKVEDDFLEHPKVIGLSDSAIALWLRGLLYASHYLTDGKIPEALALVWSTEEASDELVHARLWEPALCKAEWRIVNFEQYQRTRAEVEHEREGARLRMAAMRARRDAPVTEVLRRNNGEVRLTEVEVEKEKELTPTRAKRARKQTTECPDPFEITPAMEEWARERASGVDLRRETEKLVNWAQGKGERKVDWLATWRNWMLRRADELPALEPVEHFR